MSFYSDYGMLLEAETKAQQAFNAEVSQVESHLLSDFKSSQGEEIPKFKISAQCKTNLNSLIYSNHQRMQRLEFLRQKSEILQSVLARASRPIVDISEDLSLAIESSQAKAEQEFLVFLQLKNLRNKLSAKLDNHKRAINLNKDMLLHISHYQQKAIFLKKEAAFNLTTCMMLLQGSRKEHTLARTHRKDRLNSLRRAGRRLTHTLYDITRKLATSIVQDNSAVQLLRVKEEKVNKMHNEFNKLAKVRKRFECTLKDYKRTYLKISKLVNSSEILDNSLEAIDSNPEVVISHLTQMSVVEASLQLQFIDLVHLSVEKREELLKLQTELVQVVERSEDSGTLENLKSRAGVFFGGNCTYNELQDRLNDSQCSSSEYVGGVEKAHIIFFTGLKQLCARLALKAELILEKSGAECEELEEFARQARGLTHPGKIVRETGFVRKNVLSKTQLARSKTVYLHKPGGLGLVVAKKNEMLSQFKKLFPEHQTEINNQSKEIKSNCILKQFLSDVALCKYLNKAKDNQDPFFIRSHISELLEEAYTKYINKSCHVLGILESMTVPLSKVIPKEISTSTPLAHTVLASPRSEDGICFLPPMYLRSETNKEKIDDTKSSSVSKFAKTRKRYKKALPNLPVLQSKVELLKELKNMDRSMGLLKKNSKAATGLYEKFSSLSAREFFKL